MGSRRCFVVFVRSGILISHSSCFAVLGARFLLKAQEPMWISRTKSSHIIPGLKATKRAHTHMLTITNQLSNSLALSMLGFINWMQTENKFGHSLALAMPHFD